jgi:DNA-binding NtrC family response regulator
MMPEMTGMDLYDKLQQWMAEQAAKFIFMSGGAFTDNARAFLARSCNRVIDKPFRGAGLRQGVARFLQLESSSGTDAFSISPIASGIGGAKTSRIGISSAIFACHNYGAARNERSGGISPPARH